MKEQVRSTKPQDIPYIAANYLKDRFLPYSIIGAGASTTIFEAANGRPIPAAIATVFAAGATYIETRKISKKNEKDRHAVDFWQQMKVDDQDPQSIAESRITPVKDEVGYWYSFDHLDDKAISRRTKENLTQAIRNCEITHEIENGVVAGRIPEEIDLTSVPLVIPHEIKHVLLKEEKMGFNGGCKQTKIVRKFREVETFGHITVNQVIQWREYRNGKSLVKAYEERKSYGRNSEEPFNETRKWALTVGELQALSENIIEGLAQEHTYRRQPARKPEIVIPARPLMSPEERRALVLEQRKKLGIRREVASEQEKEEAN